MLASLFALIPTVPTKYNSGKHLSFGTNSNNNSLNWNWCRNYLLVVNDLSDFFFCFVVVIIKIAPDKAVRIRWKNNPTTSTWSFSLTLRSFRWYFPSTQIGRFIEAWLISSIYISLQRYKNYQVRSVACDPMWVGLSLQFWIAICQLSCWFIWSRIL